MQVILLMYKIRRDLLTDNKPFRHYLSTIEVPKFIQPSECATVVKTTRRLLREELDKRFFNRYTDLSVLRKSALAFEMQLLLHPSFKGLERLKQIIRVCNNHKSNSAIKVLETSIIRAVEDRVKEVMLSRIRLLLKSS